MSTDYLLRDDVKEPTFSTVSIEENANWTEGRSVSLEEANGFMELSRKAAVRIGLAVGSLILSPVCLILLAGLTEEGGGSGYVISEQMAGAVGLVVLLLMVAAGVGVLITNGMQLSRYEYLEKEKISLQYGVYGIVEKKKEEFAGTYSKCITAGVILFILGALPLIVAGAMEMKEVILLFCTALLFVMVACGVYLCIWSGTIRESYLKLLQEEGYTVKEKQINQKTGWIFGAYWCIVTAIYLGISLWKYNWGISWIIWPVAGVFFAAFASVVKAAVQKN